MADQLSDGRRFRALTIVDVFTIESVAIEVGQRLKGADVVRVLSRIGMQRAVPKTLFCDNGTEFTSQAMDLWHIMPECVSVFRGQENLQTMRMSSRSTAHCARSAWMRTGSGHSRKPRRRLRRGAGNTTRAVLTQLTGRGRHTKSLVNSRLAANSQAQQAPKTHSRDKSHPA